MTLGLGLAAAGGKDGVTGRGGHGAVSRILAMVMLCGDKGIVTVAGWEQ